MFSGNIFMQLMVTIAVKHKVDEIYEEFCYKRTLLSHMGKNRHKRATHVFV